MNTQIFYLLINKNNSNIFINILLYSIKLIILLNFYLKYYKKPKKQFTKKQKKLKKNSKKLKKTLKKKTLTKKLRHNSFKLIKRNFPISIFISILNHFFKNILI